MIYFTDQSRALADFLRKEFIELSLYSVFILHGWLQHTDARVHRVAHPMVPQVPYF